MQPETIQPARARKRTLHTSILFHVMTRRCVVLTLFFVCFCSTCITKRITTRWFFVSHEPSFSRHCLRTHKRQRWTRALFHHSDYSTCPAIITIEYVCRQLKPSIQKCLWLHKGLVSCPLNHEHSILNNSIPTVESCREFLVAQTTRQHWTYFLVWDNNELWLQSTLVHHSLAGTRHPAQTQMMSSQCWKITSLQDSLWKTSQLWLFCSTFALLFFSHLIPHRFVSYQTLALKN